jgi:hypothetical protein
MADEGEFMFFPPGTPDEVIQAVHAQHHHHRMAEDERRHLIGGLVHDMPLDKMLALRMLLHACAEESTRAAFFEGALSVRIADAEDVCWSCGRNHDAELAATMEREREAVFETMKETAASAEPDSDRANYLSAEPDTAGVEFMGMCEAYNVEPTGDGIKVQCKGCGTVYVSLADRMVAGMDECHGCVEKAKWG